MNIIPVVDLLNGISVHAVAGRRNEYRPLRSQLVDSVDPSLVLPALEAVCRSGIAYIADLDAILRRELNRCTLTELTQQDIRLMVDAGVRSCRDAEELFALGINDVIVGLESLPDPQTAADLLSQFGPQSLILSIDLRNGRPLATHPAWQNVAPHDLLAELTELEFQRWIVLDLAAVGVSAGVPTRELCRQLRALRPHDEVITGGGIRGTDDLHQLQQSGIDGALIASALHNGLITAQDVAAL